MENERAVQYLDDSITQVINDPNKHGGYYAVELQVIRLLEVRKVLLNPSNPGDPGQEVTDRFLEIMFQEFPNTDGPRLYVRANYDRLKWQMALHRIVATCRMDAIPFPPREVSMTAPRDVVHESGLREIDDAAPTLRAPALAKTLLSRA